MSLINFVMKVAARDHRQLLVLRKGTDLTITNMIQSMQKIPRPMAYWPVAVNRTVHILNQTPTLMVKNDGNRPI